MFAYALFWPSKSLLKTYQNFYDFVFWSPAVKPSILNSIIISRSFLNRRVFPEAIMAIKATSQLLLLNFLASSFHLSHDLISYRVLSCKTSLVYSYVKLLVHFNPMSLTDLSVIKCELFLALCGPKTDLTRPMIDNASII